MKSRSRIRWHASEGVRWIVVWSAILSFGSTPVPFPDLHDLRHYDAPGESCPLHHHLRTLHSCSDAGAPPVNLHCHWLRLRSYAAPWATAPDAEHDDAPRFDSSDSADALGPCPFEWAPPGTSVCQWLRWLDNDGLAGAAWGISLAAPAVIPRDIRGRGAPGPFLIHDFTASYKPSVSRSSLLSRWVC